MAAVGHCCAGILDELDPSERKLFSDNIRRLDKRIHQGMTKLTWSSKGVLLLLLLMPTMQLTLWARPWCDVALFS